QALAAAHLVQVALGVDQHQGGPGAYAVAPPDDPLGVVDHRVGDLVAQDGLADRFGVLLVVELGRVYADDDQDAGVLGLQLGQVRQGVDAVDAAERPEVEQDDAALEVGQADGAGGVEPGSAAVQLGRGNL